MALATWSNDGKFLYASTLTGGRGVTYRIRPENGSLRSGPMECLWVGGLVRETPDSKYVLYWKTTAPRNFRRSLPGDLSRNPEETLVADFWPTNQLGGYAPCPVGSITSVETRKENPDPSVTSVMLPANRSTSLPRRLGLATGLPFRRTGGVFCSREARKLGATSCR
jgi:hypothetical protein